MMWKTSRVTTSKMTERFSLRIVRPPCSHVPRPGLLDGSDFEVARESRVLRVRTKMRLAMPVAAATSTDTSPRVSQARMSTSVTLTMFLPWPNA